MATGLINPLGAVCLFDGEVPRTFSAVARGVISGGDFVFVSGTAGAVGSQASSYVASDIQVAHCDAEARVNGLALGNAGSGELVTVATRGTYFLKADAAVSGGQLVVLGANFDGVQNVTASVGSDFVGVIGRAITEAGSDSYCLVSLNL